MCLINIHTISQYRCEITIYGRVYSFTILLLNAEGLFFYSSNNRVLE